MKFHRLILLLVATTLGFSTRAQDPGHNYPFATGTIEKLHSANNQITLKTAAGSKMFFVTTAAYLIDGTAIIPFDKLKLGDLIAINYFTNNTGLAIIRRLKIKHPDPDELPDKTK